MNMVREALGPDAVILSTREIKDPDPAVEITAGVEHQGGSVRPGSAMPESSSPYAPGYGRAAYLQAAGLSPAVQPAETDYGPAFSGLSYGLTEIKDLLLDLTHRAGLSERFRDRTDLIRLYRDLLDAELDPAIARALVEKAGSVNNGDGGDPRALLMKVLSRRLKVSAPGESSNGSGPACLALAGPSGVGKTTTLAKLAARWVKAGQKVALISLDTFRLGAAEQLRTYARIMGLPVRVVQNSEEFTQALELFDKQDRILIDTAGRSLSDPQRFEELTETLAAIEKIEVLLVLSAATKDRDLAASIKQVETLPVNSLVISKIDETQRYGNVINNLLKYNRPVSFLTNGQKVPDDILPATPSRLAELIISGATSA